MLRAVANIPRYIGSYAYASLPAASANSGLIAMASDVGPSPGMELISDGTRWIPNGVQVLARSAAALTVPADVTEDTLVTITVPAGLMGVNGSARITSHWSWTNSANSKTPRIYFGTVSGTKYYEAALTTNSELVSQIWVRNRGAANSQVGNATNTSVAYATSGGTPTTSAINTASSTTIVITGQKASSGETMKLESYLVEILP